MQHNSSYGAPGYQGESLASGHSYLPGGPAAGDHHQFSSHVTGDGRSHPQQGGSYDGELDLQKWHDEIVRFANDMRAELDEVIQRLQRHSRNNHRSEPISAANANRDCYLPDDSSHQSERNQTNSEPVTKPSAATASQPASEPPNSDSSERLESLRQKIAGRLAQLGAQRQLDPSAQTNSQNASESRNALRGYSANEDMTAADYLGAAEDRQSPSDGSIWTQLPNEGGRWI